MEEKLVSIIVPVFNSKDYIAKCLDSILMQTYSNIEILLIDDGSTDGSKEICDNYANRDKRIKLYHKKNTGVSDTRNYALKYISGEFICFVDSDDYVDKQFIEMLLKNMIETNSDISICGQYRVFNNYRRKFYKNDILLIEDKEILDLLISQKYFQGHMWDKMYRKELFDHVEFSKDVKFYEDLLINYKIFKQAKKVVFDSKPLYYYFQNPESALNNGYNKEKMFFINVCDDIKKYYELNKYNLKYINNLTDYLYICNANDIASNYKKNLNKEYKTLVKFIRKNILRIIFKDEMSVKHKIVGIIIFFNKKCYIPIAKIIKVRGLKKY